MKRFRDRTTLLVGGALLLALIAAQTTVVLRRQASLNRTIESANNLAARMDANDLPDMTRDDKLYSGKVYDKWSKMPYTGSFDAWDFYPDLRPSE